MAVTFAGSSWLTAAGVKTVTATPAVGDMIVVVCANSGRTTAQPPTITDNNSAGTYTQVKAATRASSVDAMWVFCRNATVAAATSTIFTMTPTATDTGGGLAVYRVTLSSGVGASAVAQSGSQDNVASGTPAITLTNPITWDHALIGGVMTGTNGSANCAPPSGWTEDLDIGMNTPPTGFETVSFAGGTQATTVTWGGAAASAFCSILVEMNGPAAVPLPLLTMALYRTS